MKNKDKSFSELAKDLRAMVSKYSCSFTDDERVLLQECITLLDTTKSGSDWVKFTQDALNVLSILARVFSSMDHFKDWF